MAGHRAIHSFSTLLRLEQSSAKLLPRTTQQIRHLSIQSQLHAHPQHLIDPQKPNRMPRLRQPKRHFTTTLHRPEEQQQSSQQSKIYKFTEIQSLSKSPPTPSRILIDVREPSELQSTGQIPNSLNVPISSSPDAFFLPPDEFEDKFGFVRPDKDAEVVFYCKAGVRSRAAAKLAQQAGFGGKVGEFPGSWIEWVEKGGEVERKGGFGV